MNTSIDATLCRRCKLCAEICPVQIFSVSETGEVAVDATRDPICLGCGQCMAVCASGAVSVEGYDYDRDLFPRPDNPVGYAAFSDFLATRRSVRNFKDEPVARASLQQILEALRFAPYGAEPLGVEIVAVDDRALIEAALPQISEFLDNVVTWIENPIARFFIRRKKGIETFSTLKNHLYPMAKLGSYKLSHGDRITRGAPAMLIFHARPDAEEHTDNAMIFATYAMLAAHALGLGTMMSGIVPAAINKVPSVRKHFSIPEQDEAVIALLLGHPRYRYRRAIRRTAKRVTWLRASPDRGSS